MKIILDNGTDKVELEGEGLIGCLINPATDETADDGEKPGAATIVYGQFKPRMALMKTAIALSNLADTLLGDPASAVMMRMAMRELFTYGGSLAKTKDVINKVSEVEEE